MSTQHHQLISEAQTIIPGGVNSPVRAFGAVGGDPIFMQSARGAYLTDVTGKEYIDYVGSWGPCILGHAPQPVIEAVKAAADNGTSFGAATAAEIEMAHKIVAMVPSVEMVRLVNSGTEATLSAVRLARAFTGRDKIIKFSGCYHGHGDSFLVQAGSGATTLGVPTSPGVTAANAADTLLADINDPASVQCLIEQYPDAIAALITEPVVGNAGVIPPQDGYLQQIRHLTAEAGILLIFDEVMTGFRLAAGGAQQLYGITPDLTTLGKVIGGGLPIGAFGGRRDIMQMLAPAGPVYQAGTLSGNPLAVAAGLTTLELLTDDVYATLEQRSAQLETGITAILQQRSLPYTYQRVGSMGCLFCTDEPVTDYESAKKCDTQAFARYFHNMIDQGVYLPPSQFEAYFISAAHSETDIDRTLQAVERSLPT